MAASTLVVALMLLVAPVHTAAAQGAKVYRVGVLIPGSQPGPSVATAGGGIPTMLRERGYVEGRNLVVENRFADGQLERLPALARELVQMKVDALVCPSPVAVEAAKRATNTIPIVMLLAYSDPVALGFVASLSRPGRNITGVLLAAEPAIAGKRLELAREALPAATRIAFLATDEASSRLQAEWVQKAAASLGVKLSVVEVRGRDYDRAFAAMVGERTEVVLVAASVVLSTDHVRVIQLAAKHRLPAIYDFREHVEAGALMAYGGSVAGFARRAAAYVDRIFKGANPADLPVERASVFELAINLKTAKSLGLTMPSSLLARADHVIQ